MDSSSFAEIATAVAAFIAVVQLWLFMRQRKAEFELKFDARYEDCVRRLSLGALLDESEYDSSDEDARRALYDYFELCEQEVHYRIGRRITRKTWREWRDGIELNFAKPFFREGWDDLGAAAPSQFAEFRKYFSHLAHIQPKPVDES